jgi:hypothetical protein
MPLTVSLSMRRRAPLNMRLGLIAFPSPASVQRPKEFLDG